MRTTPRAIGWAARSTAGSAGTPCRACPARAGRGGVLREELPRYGLPGWPGAKRREVEKFLHADFDNPGTLEYFVDKIYLTDDGLVVTSRYSEDRTEITWDMLYGEGDNPLKGKPSSSTVSSLAPPIADNFFMWRSFDLWRKFGGIIWNFHLICFSFQFLNRYRYAHMFYGVNFEFNV